MRPCLPGAMSPDNRSRSGALPSRGVLPRFTKRAHVRRSSAYVPLNGHASYLLRHTSKYVRACVHACTRDTLKGVSQIYGYGSVSVQNLHFEPVEGLPKENVHVSCNPGKCTPLLGVFRSRSGFKETSHTLASTYVVYMALLRDGVSDLSLIRDLIACFVMCKRLCLGVSP